MYPGEFLSSRVKNKQLKPVTLFIGAETYWKQIIIERLKKAFLEESSAQMNFISFDAKSNTVSEVLEEANAFGFFQSKKIILFNSIDELDSEEMKPILSYIESPNTESYLILNAVKPDNRLALLKNKDIKEETVEFEIRSEKDIKDFIDFKLIQLGNLKLDKKLESYLLSVFSSDLGLLAQNLDKIAAYNNFTSPLRLSENDMEHLITSPEQESNSFKFIDAITSRDFGKAFTLYKNLSGENNNVHGLIGLLRWNFQSILKASFLLKNNVSKEEICSQCKIPPFKRNFFFKTLETLKDKELQNIYTLIANCDYSLKSSNISPEHFFESLIFNICKKS
ncbi:MAG: hypothetical protein ACD_79C00147G0005 [uncultured bacterium]|nr:MAG: hypothetical protein ACD_79C00147G0005 [uncultured bacterium]